VFLLPHGHEGQGPEHSSARPERFLQSAADINMRVMNCTTAAQYFHLLRRQAALLRRDPLPLILLTPKSLLRHPAVASTPQELEEGRFRSVIDDVDARARAKTVSRLVLCSGKVYVDLVTSDLRGKADKIAICRVEQLYPFPKNALGEVLGLGVAALIAVAVAQSHTLPPGEELLLVSAAFLAIGAYEGAIVGAAQWLVLRRLLPSLRAKQWVGATMAGAVVAGKA
jgi:hypothetical protein